MLHLNQTAAEYAFCLTKGLSALEAGKHISKRYRIPNVQAEADFLEFKARLEALIKTPDLDPETFLDFDQQALFSSEISAPFRLDCALTYCQTDGDGKNVAPVECVDRELTLAEWKTVLDKAWAAGIPHVVFTGGEPTIRPDLLDLIAYAQSIGQVSGLLTDGSRLTDSAYLHKLLMTGLDHLMILLDPENDETWDAVRSVLPEDISTTIHLTITEQNKSEIIPLLDYLARLGVHNLSLSIVNATLKDELLKTRQAAAERGLQLVWDLPVPYSQMHPVAIEKEGFEEMPQGAGKAWLYVEPDGDVLPGQGINTVLGNILTDPWEKIWKST
jgi:MoaA/NifB/PqqE/SkfB family radical SAM enzyme